MIIKTRKRFVKSFDKAPAKIAKKVNEVLLRFEHNPFDSILHNHGLTGNRKGQRSINVSGDWRIVFVEQSNGRYELVELIDLGTHSKLYG